MLFRVLGPLEVESENGRLILGGARQRAVLATLVLHVNEVVPRDRLLEAVWGENPPDTAASALQGYVSALRKTLGAGVIVTRAPGYALEARPNLVDLHLFESLAATGADALAEGDATRAAELLREALALWRGQPLADLDSVEFVRLERLRLGELRLGVLADRIDADLGLGRHGEVVGELRSLVGEHPLRERFRAQLMLALYRSGRQAEALDVYQQGRSLLAAELGIEPGEPLKRLERSILQQDEAIAPPAAAPRRRTAPRPRRASRRLVLAALVVGALAASAVLAVVLTHSAASAAPVRANSIAVIDTRSNRVVRDLPIDGNPVAIASGPAGVYVASEQDGIVWRIDARRRRVVKKRGVFYDVHDIAVGFGSVWLADGTDGTVTRLDDHLRALTDVIRLPGPQPGPPAFWIATGVGRVWVTRGDSVVEINPKNDQVIHQVAIPNPSGLAVGLGAVWVASGHRFTRFEPGKPPVRVSAGPLPAPVLAPTIGQGSVWSIDYNDLGEVSRISDGGSSLAFINGRLGRYPLDVAVDDHAAWTIDTQGTVTRIDPASNKAVERIPTAPTIRSALTTADGMLWVAIEGPS